MKRQRVTRAKNSLKTNTLKNAPARDLTAPLGGSDYKGKEIKRFIFEVEVFPDGKTILFFESTQRIKTGERKIKTLYRQDTALLREIKKAIVIGNAQHEALITGKDKTEWQKLRKKPARDKNLSYLFGDKA